MRACMLFSTAVAAGFDIAAEMRAPTERGGVAQNIMDSGSGIDAIHAVQTTLQPRAGDSVVEIGPGSGWALREILKHKASVHAVEISQVFRDTINDDEAFQQAQTDGADRRRSWAAGRSRTTAPGASPWTAATRFIP